MHETKDSKKSILTEISERLAVFSSDEMAKKQEIIEEKLLEFANFLEAELGALHGQCKAFTRLIWANPLGEDLNITD